ncbi:transcriptional activator FtrB [Sporotomaculum syntrophicum]|uniref:Transcriptional activator FtrB n=1 Tax=Sporotomaculum syntrophicum TaxID=182264 RepID=A0A9D2WQA6_9FIRM|nr:Crp/Fnr family transcriptional regulator [Sporotomaculum syntrophicum]KAF1085128.1 transcriptional activator FtrB [Sporotomaculum syntrophicum]
MIDHGDVLYLQEHLPFFAKLDQADKRRVLDAASKSAYQQGETIHTRDTECNGLVIVKSGQLRAFFETEDGKEITLYRLLDNDICILSASCVLKNITFTVILEAEKDSVLFFIPAVFWGNLTARDIYAKQFAMELVAERFSEVMWVMEQIVSKNMRQRIAVFLLEQSVLETSDILTMTHESIAKNLGTAREVISRILKYLENDGIIKLSRGQIHIVNLPKLKEIGR